MPSLLKTNTQWIPETGHVAKWLDVHGALRSVRGRYGDDHFRHISFGEDDLAKYGSYFDMPISWRLATSTLFIFVCAVIVSISAIVILEFSQLPPYSKSILGLLILDSYSFMRDSNKGQLELIRHAFSVGNATY
jgi:hypothetical protein